MHRLSSSFLSARLRLALPVLAGAALAATTLLASADAHAQTRRGALTILGLRAPDGEDEAASQATEALRQAARAAGFTVGDDAAPLEQLVAALGCEDPLPNACLAQIGQTIHSERFLYGTVRRATRERTGPLRVEVQLFTAGQSALGAPQSAELPRATVLDAAQLRAPTRRMLDGLLPPPAPTVVTPPPTVRQPPPATTQPLPIRRYIAYGLLGLGGAMIVGGVISGGVWFGLSGELGGNNASSTRAMQWQQYQPYGDMRDGSGRDICRAAQPTLDASLVAMSPYVQTYNTNHSALRQNAADLCAQNETMQGAGFGLLAAGAAVAATGLVLLVTDRPASSGTRSLRPRIPPLVISPNFSPGYQGASVLVHF